MYSFSLPLPLYDTHHASVRFCSRDPQCSRLWSYRCFLRRADSSFSMPFVTFASPCVGQFYLFLLTSWLRPSWTHSLFVVVSLISCCSPKMLWRRKYPLSVVIITIFVIIQRNKICAPWSIIIQPVIRSHRVRTVRHRQPLISPDNGGSDVVIDR